MLSWEETGNVSPDMLSRSRDMQEINESVQVYLAEANILELNALGGNRHVIVQQLLTYNVIIKRQTELNELKRGMDEVSLIGFLRANPSCHPKLFPPANEMHVSFSVIKPFIENSTESDSAMHWNFLMQYVEELCQRNRGMHGTVILYSTHKLHICV